MSSRFRSIVALAVAALVVAVAIATSPTPASAAPTVPTGFTNTLVTGSLGLAVDVTDLPDGRVLVAAQDGQIWVVAANGTKVATPATTITGLCRANEQGLLGIEADPAFGSNHYIYVYYTADTTTPDCTNRVVRLTMSGDSVVPSSDLTLIDGIASNAPNHEGGDIQLGKDGNLYISSGDDADGVNARDRLNNLAGKILRIKPDGTIPTGNPYTGSGTARCNAGPVASGTQCQEIVAYGFRNPFRIAADPNASGTRIFVNDVGLGTAEEIDELQIGGNFGWPDREGLCDIGSRNNCHSNQAGDPLFDYTHAANPGCVAITGGAFVPNTAWPARYSGGYLYGDEGCGKIWVLLPNGAGGWTNEEFSTGAGAFTSMRTVQQNGAWSVLYTTFANGGELHRITANCPTSTTKTSAFHPLVTPTRILDTRNGTGYTGRKPAGGDTIAVQVTGGATSVPSDAVAVAMNVTGTEANAAGYVTAWPNCEARPLASSINFSNANDTVANEVIVRVGTGGSVNLFTQNGAHLVADITGYWTETVTSQAGRYVPAPNPARVLDTRVGTGVTSAGIVAAGGTVDLQVTGRGNVPSSGVSAVALVVTIANSTTSGYVTAWPTGQTKPLASSVNPVGVNDIRSNLVIVPVGTGGKVSLYTLQPSHLVADVAGWFTDGTAPSARAGLMVALSPRRLIDTRNNNPFARLNGGDTGVPKYTPAIEAGSIAIVTNLTVDGTAAGGYLTAWPFDQSRPLASNVNWNGSGQTRAALALSKLSPTDEVAYFPNVGTDLVVDFSGYFVGATAPA